MTQFQTPCEKVFQSNVFVGSFSHMRLRSHKLMLFKYKLFPRQVA